MCLFSGHLPSIWCQQFFVNNEMCKERCAGADTFSDTQLLHNYTFLLTSHVDNGFTGRVSNRSGTTPM
jgi:hypothetical protein